MDYKQKSLEMHAAHRGKIEVTSKITLSSKDDLSIAYTPGVAEPCLHIHRRPDDSYTYTAKGNLVAVVSDGTAVLGLGNIGPAAALPVMEGKAILFKEFAGVDAFPLCIASCDVDEIVRFVQMIEPTFGGINLEDISSPRCVEIERRLKETTNIPIFHDDQHGTAVVTAAALINALKIVGKDFANIRIVISGAGAAGNAIMKMLLAIGANDIIVCGSRGILANEGNKNWVQDEMAQLTNPRQVTGGLADAMIDADVFIGVSAKDIVSEAMVSTMNSNAIVLAMANPDPEILPSLALKAGARIVGTGRSDYDNQINNVLAFPGIFRGALDARASDINEPMKWAAAQAIANLIDQQDLTENNIIPYALDTAVAKAVAKAVYNAAFDSGVARKKMR